MKKLLLGAVILMALVAFGGKLEAPPTPPEEPPLPLAPLPYYEPVEPIPEPELEEPIPVKKLPPGVNCFEDCPLIDPAEIGQVVRAYYKDVPILAEVARCESHFKHYTPDGVLMNKQGSSATGVMQLMAIYHEETAESLGWSIRDLEGNLAYARWLYDREGLQPWEASRYCWGSDLVAVNKGISDV
jgi:hypothetical protein